MKTSNALDNEICNLKELIARMSNECREKDAEIARLSCELQATLQELNDTKGKLDCAVADATMLTSERDALNEAVDCMTSALFDIREGLTASYEALDVKYGKFRVSIYWPRLYIWNRIF